MNKYIIGLTAMFGTVIFAQNKELTMNEAVLGIRAEGKYYQWLPESDQFYEKVKTGYGNALVAYDASNLKVDTLLTSKSFKETNNVPNLSWFNKNEAYYNDANSYKWFKFSDKKSTNWFECPENFETIEIDGKSKQAAYVVDNNLFLVDANGKTSQITKDGKYGIVNGKTVHREEFGIHKGIFFSPNGNFLAFYRMDETMVEDYPILDWSAVPAVNKNIKYPFAGRTIHQVKIGVYNPKTKQTIFLQTGEPKDQYLTCVTWSPDEKSIYVAVLNRDQNHMKLNQYDANSGKLIQTLFEEKDAKYVEPQNELHFLPNGKEFVWWSQRDGFMHLYRYDLNGKLINPITKGNWLVNEIVGQNEKKKELLITSTKDGAMEKHLYTVNWETGKMERVDTTPGYHFFTANDAGTYVIDNWSNETTPRKIDLLSTDKKINKNLFTAENPLADYQMPKVENVTLKADDGTDLYGKLIYPTNFNSAKKYPVIVYLYNGPHAQLNLNRFPASGNLWYDYMAQNGYVVWVMDGRGSSNRGLKFEQAIHRNLGEIEMSDQMKGVNYLKSLPFVDGDRMGIHGWSYGGFMTTSFMLRKPDVFKVGVAGGPVLDWSMYEAMYGERYMGTPENNANGYATNLLMDKTKNLKGELLIIHGTQDPVVVWQHSIDFLRNAVSNGVQVDYFVYPGYEHNVRGIDRVHLMQKISDYFDLYLKK
ncbi:S9 family peptidase [Moheibacter lacus]|uniref:DPP IV N-terminal domain-containing protein n=1 Tax=Moheibacter lacus TaxID=2745851 RepID=A0A838ZIH8_9FLAO|nr:DPP IV N-terminal domain-containing protein [Moheibacter lacus]MBA5629058.1 DPP IV N-terminal domain-containing protein [Moheibacter lacus]